VYKALSEKAKKRKANKAKNEKDISNNKICSRKRV
jgi:hypothetical protein